MKPRLLYLAVFLLLLNLAFFVFTILPARRAVRAHATTLQDLQGQIQTLRHEQRQQEVLNTLQKRMGQFRNRIPPQESILAMIRRVTDQARRLNLYVPSVKYQPGEVPEDALVKLTVQMEVEGRYAAVRRFLYEVEGLQDPLTIEKLVLTNHRETDRITLRLQMGTFFLPEASHSKREMKSTEHPVQETRARAER